MSAVAYLGSILAGWVIAQTWGAAADARHVVDPVLIALMVLTFLEIPLAKPQVSLKILAVVLGLNGVAVPLLVWGLMSIVELPPALAIPATIVLLAPCVDYVVAFTRAAGGAWHTMAALTPVLLLAQLIAVFAWASGRLELAWELARAGIVFLLLPMLIAQGITRLRPRWATLLGRAMDPVTCLLLLCISSGYGANLDQTSPKVVLIYLTFTVCALAAASVVASILHLVPGERTMVQLTTMTRNSLIVLPIALAVAPNPAVTPVVVITQTFVELCVLSLVVWVKKHG